MREENEAAMEALRQDYSNLKGRFEATKSELELVKIRRYEYKFTFLYLLKSNVQVEMLRLQPEEVESVKWMSLDEIEELCRQGLFNRTHYRLLRDCVESDYFRK